MHIVMDAGQMAKVLFGVEEPDRENERTSLDVDVVDLSKEALRRHQQSIVDRVRSGAYTLEMFDNRINQVHREIEKVRKSALPDRVKEQKTDAKETEISLLQAGQFEYLKGVSTIAVA